jgi:hypothetical protein
MVNSVENKVVGLSKDEIISLLGKADGEGGNFTPPDRGLYYILRSRNNSMNYDIFVIYLDENLIAIKCGIRKT